MVLPRPKSSIKSAISHLRESAGLPHGCPTSFRKLAGMNTTPAETPRLSLAHALRIKAAEYWLQQGQAQEALQELAKLPETVWSNQRVTRARVAAMGILRQRNEIVMFR